MTDPVDAFRQSVAGKSVPFRIPAGPSETLAGEPLGVSPATEMTLDFDDDGFCLPMWETDEPPQGV